MGSSPRTSRIALVPTWSSKVPNLDRAGTVDAVGPGVAGLAVGDRVWLWDVSYGTDEGDAQEYVTLPAAHAVPLPHRATFDEGASVGIPALTAHLALTADKAGPSRLGPGALAGRTVLVTGGAGAVGHAAIQLAAWAGATVVTTVSSDARADLARRAGAHHTIDYRTQDVPTAVKAIAPDGVDRIVDVGIVANIEDDVAVVAADGTIAAYTNAGGSTATVPLQPLMSKNVDVRFVLTSTAPAAAKDAAIAGVTAALADGALHVGEDHGLPITRFPLAETTAAQDAVQHGAVGKVLIDVA